MQISNVYDDGSILPQSILTLDPSSLIAKFQQGIRNIAGLSLSAGYPIEATVPIIISNAFKNIAALSLESGYKVKEVETIASSAPVATEAKKEAPKKEEAKKTEAPKKVEAPPAPEEEEMDMGGLFD